MSGKYVFIDGNPDLESRLADPTSAANGDALMAVLRDDLTGAVATTGHIVNRSLPVYVEWGFGFTRGVGLSGAQRLANGVAINAAQAAAKAIGSYVQLPAGPSEYDGSLLGFNGVNVYGHGNMGEKAGSVYVATSLRYYGNSYALDLLGTSVSVDTRIQCCWSDLIIDCSNAGTAGQAVRCGWNQRAQPLLRNVTLLNSGSHGLHFADQNWNVSFENLRVDACGRSTTNTSGIFKDTTIDSGTWNAISFLNLQVEGCGTSSSAAGGINLPTTTANRGLHFGGLTIVEGNSGTDEIFISNMADLIFDDLYIERLSVAGQTTGAEISGCKGTIRGGYVTGQNVANNLYGVQLKASSEFDVSGLTTATWATGGIVNYSSKVYTGRNPGSTYANGDASAQWFGDYSPRVSAHKNGANQTAIASGVFTKVTFPTSRYDLTSCLAASTCTPQAIGTYQVDAQVNWTATADQDILVLSVYVNGAAYKSSYVQASGTGQTAIRFCGQVDTNAVGDTIEVYVRQTSGAAKDISGASGDTWFMVSLIGRTT